MGRDHTCEIVSVSPVLLAVTAADLARGELPTRIRGMYDVVYGWLRTASVKQAGHNYAVYDGAPDGRLHVQIGFPVSAEFVDTDQVRCVELAGGRAARTTHVGPYGNLGVAWDRAYAWCAQEAVPLRGQGWEVYGDWHEDPARLETDVYLRLR